MRAAFCFDPEQEARDAPKVEGSFRCLRIDFNFLSRLPRFTRMTSLDEVEWDYAPSTTQASGSMTATSTSAWILGMVALYKVEP
jgi:hypothetical protein